MFKEIITPKYISIIWSGEHPYDRGTASSDFIDNYWYINRVVVQPETKRSQGIGSELLQRLIDAIKSQNGREIKVTPSGYNTDPKIQIRFYEKFGFKRQEDCYSLKLKQR
jgi:ribosomal protein S18 acetylase RimI-like enzyme